MRKFRQVDPSTHIYIFGSSEKVDLDFEAEQLGILSDTKLADLYRRCSTGLCLSASNPSRIGFEMLACGLPVVELYRENNLYDFEDCVLLAEPSAGSISLALSSIVKDKDLQSKVSKAARSFMKKRSDKKEDESFARAIEAIVDHTNHNFSRYTVTYMQNPIIAEPRANERVNQLLKNQKIERSEYEK